jgi:hypothetical protein
MPGKVETKPVGSLTAPDNGKPAAFRIPAYQRGYRWKSDDVKRLLKDLNEFLDEAGQEKCRPFYCLQPLVVTKSDKHNCWEVVDGQQRLTTLFLLWKFLNDHSPYELSYDTRDRSRIFLNSPNEQEKGENIDFHHIYHAHAAVKEWFEDKETEKERFKELLADKNSKGRNVRFIWYELGADDDAVAAFTRLNVGKISLTDEELIRALFLRNPKGGELAGAFQHRLALDWDRIETALQEPDFWGFVSNQPPPEGGRIRLLFELNAGKCDTSIDHWLFRHYEGKLKVPDSNTLLAEWQLIVSSFEQLEEWYRDPELFHLVGFRTTILGKESAEALRKLLDDAKSATKSEFATDLRQAIRTGLIGKAEEVSVTAFVSGLSYSTSLKTRQTLALFNIATVLRTKGVQIRFPFHLYHDTKGSWDIEHIQSQAGDGLGDKKRQLAWLESCKPEIVRESMLQLPNNNLKDDSEKLSPSALLADIEGFEKPDSKQDFSDLEKRIRAYFREKEAGEEEIHSIGNLTLLDAPTNRGYGNAPFVVKRTEILKPERTAGTFILPCTRDLFLKVYSKDPGNLRHWDIEKDGAAHEEAIHGTLETFFGEKGGAKP